jgi:GR25 family glycosyltransferase involved in LPS biosynthesis
LIAVGVVAHNKRSDVAHQLMEDAGAMYMSVDNGTRGCTKNHRQVWTHLSKRNSEYCVVLEDDAVLCDDFPAQLEAALAVAPADIVSLYLGTGRPVWYELNGRGSARQLQPLLEQTILQAEQQDASFITTHRLFHAVGVAIKTSLVQSMLDHTRDLPHPMDAAISDWCHTHGHQVAYTVPSLVDHADTASIHRHADDGVPYTQQRKAHRFGARTQWTPLSVPIPDPEPARVRIP